MNCGGEAAPCGGASCTARQPIVGFCCDAPQPPVHGQVGASMHGHWAGGARHAWAGPSSGTFRKLWTPRPCKAQGISSWRFAPSQKCEYWGKRGRARWAPNLQAPPTSAGMLPLQRPLVPPGSNLASHGMKHAGAHAADMRDRIPYRVPERYLSVSSRTVSPPGHKAALLGLVSLG